MNYNQNHHRHSLKYFVLYMLKDEIFKSQNERIVRLAAMLLAEVHYGHQAFNFKILEFEDLDGNLHKIAAVTYYDWIEQRRITTEIYYTIELR